jgi:hypothetical protein
MEDPTLERRVGQLEQQMNRMNGDDLWDKATGVGTSISGMAAAIALVLTILVFAQTNTMQANIAAGDALQRHFEYAADRGVWVGQDPATQEASAYSPGQYRSAAIHGLYSANLIYDVAEGSGELRSWEHTASDLLQQYEKPLKEVMKQEDLRCDELDRDFLEFARQELGGDWCPQIWEGIY